MLRYLWSMVNGVKKMIWLSGEGDGDLISKGQDEKNDVIVSPSSTYTWNIPLDSDKFQMGIVMLYLPVDVLSRRAKRRFADIMIGTTKDEAMSEASSLSTTSISTYIIYNDYPRGYDYEDDGKLSDVWFSALSGQLRIESARINESNLEVIFNNIHGSQNATLTMKLRYMLWG